MTALTLKETFERFRRVARYNYVPGMTDEDVGQEMSALYVKLQNMQGKNPDEGYFWQSWKNLRIDLMRKAHATSDKTVLMPLSEIVLYLDPEAPASMYERISRIGFPRDFYSELEHAVWNLSAMGYTQTEIRKLLDVSLRRYYSVIHGLRDPKIYNLLTDKELRDE
jgi:DNA-directed RNA polymerase specialized sigma24 family protein